MDDQGIGTPKLLDMHPSGFNDEVESIDSYRTIKQLFSAARAVVCFAAASVLNNAAKIEK